MKKLTQAAFVKTYLVWHKVDRDRALAHTRRCLVNHKVDVWRATRHEVADQASNIGVDMTAGEAMTGLAVTERLPDGRVIFALNAAFGPDPSKDSIKAITWTNEDGSPGKLYVSQKR